MNLRGRTGAIAIGGLAYPCRVAGGPAVGRLRRHAACGRWRLMPHCSSQPAPCRVPRLRPTRHSQPRPPARRAATRRGDARGRARRRAGSEVLLSRRAERGDHNSGAWVFPGGVVDAGDRAAHALCEGLDDRTASARLGLEAGGLDYYVAAIRECFEEAGLLFASGAHGELVVLDDAKGLALGEWRGALHRTSARSATSVRRRAAIGGRPARLPQSLADPARARQALRHPLLHRCRAGRADGGFDGTELVEQLWIRPADALARRRRSS